ncbi:MAG TPA: TonB-dependent receptor [Noviherbaspirillum sp.]
MTTTAHRHVGVRRLYTCAIALPAVLAASSAFAQQDKPADTIVVSANRMAQTRFDAAASIDAVEVDALHAASPLVNLSELMGTVPGIQVRERQNYAQDLQLSVRGFGTRSTFGVRGVRILIDGIPASMPDGQGQAATASLASAKRIEVLRGPVAQLYGNAAGGVVQVFTKEPPFGHTEVNASAGAGSYGQRQLEAGIAGGSENLAGLLDVMHYQTDGYRDHSATERTQINGKAVWKLSADTTLTGIVNSFNQPLAQDPLGLSRSQMEQNPRQVVPGALTFDTRKTIENQQEGLLLEHKLGTADTLNARLYTGTRKVMQTLSTSGLPATSAGGVVDLNNDFHGAAMSWTHAMKANGLPLNWTVGIDGDALRQWRRGFVNNNGTAGAARRDEIDRASNVDLFGQIDWTLHPEWKASLGVRSSRVRLAVEDHYVNASSPDDSGSVEYTNTSPVVGLVWNARDDLNVYANLGRGFETPTLTEIAYRPGATGTNLSLRPSRSTQGEIGAKWRSGRHSVDVALFQSRSSDEIVPFTSDNGRSTFQNVDQVERRGIETSWKAQWGRFTTQAAYTLLDATFGKSYAGAGGTVAAGNRLPGAPQHSLFTQVDYRPMQDMTLGAEMRVESKVYVDDMNSEAAPGYAVFNLRAAQEFRAGTAKWVVFGRIDNVLDRNYAGSVIVNESNRRFYEPAAGRRLFVGLRTSL